MLYRTIFTACVLSSQAIAETTLPTIVISGGRTAETGLDIPAATTIIDDQQIEESGARNVAEVLHRIPGIHVADSIGDGGSAKIDMRGFGSTAQSNVAVLVNGRKINPATDGATLYLNSIPLNNVQRIEVIEGSAGVLYGNQAVGGLINIITKRPGSRRGHVTVGAGSYDAWEIDAGFNQPLSDRVGLGAQVLRRDSDNYRDHNASRIERIDARLEVAHHAGYSYVEAQQLNDYVETPGALLESELEADRRQAIFPDDYLDTDSKVLRLGTQQQFSEHWQLEAELARRDDHRDFVQSFRGFPGTESTQDRDVFELTPRVIGRFDGTLITLGVDYLDSEYDLLTAFGPQGNDQQIASWYGQVSTPVAQTVTLTTGARHARVENDIDNGGIAVELDDSVTVGSIGLTYRPTSQWRAFLRADQNYRFAKVDEHTNVPFGQPVGLKNQRGVSLETGMAYNNADFNLSLRAYKLRLKDEISFDAVTFTNVNLPRSRRYGFVVSGDVAINRLVTVGGGYEYLDSEITSGAHKGSEVPLVPKNKANAFIEYRPTADWLARLDVEYVDDQFLGSDFTNTAEPLEEYTVAHLVVHRTVGDWRFSAKVNNLFNERYSETGASAFAGDGYNPAPERNFWFGVSYQFEG